MKTGTFILLLLIALSGTTQEIVEFRGENRTGHYSGNGLLKQWPASGPKLILKIDSVGKGYSQPIFAEEKIFITGIKEDTIDMLSAYNLKGEMLWDVPYGRSWTRSYIDSRSTPTFHNGKLYVSSGTGQLNCVDANSGKIIWQVNAIEKFKGEIYKHGDAEAPLIVDDIVVYMTGGEHNTLVAFDKNNGKEVWKSKSLGGAKSYASPKLIIHNGRKIILAQTTDNLIAIDAENGEVLWNYNLIQYHEHRQGVGAQTNSPIYKNGEIFVTSGYDHPGIKFSISEDGMLEHVVWKNTDIDTHHGGNVLVDGVIYGSNWQNNANGRWAAVDWSSGKTLWENEWENKGSVIYAGERLYLYEEKRGNVALVKPSRDSLTVLSTFKVEYGTGPHWAHPAIYNGMLFIRHSDALMIYDIKDE